MRLIFRGHDYKYAAEQMLSTVFPGECPDYGETSFPGETSMVISLTEGKERTTVSCRYCTGTESFMGRAYADNAELTDELERDRQCQYIIKKAMYRAVRKAGMDRPPWGALTGVRPGKLMSSLIRSCEGLPEDKRRKMAVRRFSERYDVTKERSELCYETSLATLQTTEELKERDVCLYIGIPFCPTRCAYCSFVSQAVEKSMKLISPFFEALQTELRAIAEQVRRCGLHVVAVYFGGGTPTTLSAEQLDGLCTLLSDEFDFSRLREFTVEAGRPDTITAEKLTVLKKHGVSRLSVNPQTMNDRVLEAIGRRHTAKDITDALALVRQTGTFDVNMDLIAGLPTDTFEEFTETMRAVLSLEPENITVHTLSLKKGSELTLSGSRIPDASEVGKMLDTANRMLREAGYVPYYLYRQKNMSGGFENTGWTKPGHINIYNICMMEELCGILAAGGGGSTKLIGNGEGRNLRITAPKYPLEYIEHLEKTCSDKDKIGEFYGL